MAFINNKQVYLRSNINVDKVIKNLSWGAIKALVQGGAAAEYFAVGDVLQCNHDRYGVLEWQILDIGEVRGVANIVHENGMVLGLKQPYGQFMYDAYEALFYAPDGLPVGQYNFTLPKGYDEAHGGGKTYSFWLNKNKPLPAGGYLTFWWVEGQDASKVRIRLYAPLTNGVENFVDLVPVTEGSGGTPLEDVGQLNPNIEACRIGNSDYDTSALRQLINSTAEAGNVWTQKTPFDRPPNWVNTEAGFLNGIDKEFLNAIQGQFVTTYYYGDNMPEMINGDKMSLLAWEEVNGVDRSLNNTDGYKTFEYYNVTQPTNGELKERVKTYKDDTAAFWLLRSQKPVANNSYVSIVNANGTLNYVQPFNDNNGVVPVCVIY